MSVPVTALTAATATETSSVNLKAATASRLETVFQNPSRPRSVLLATSAASGSRTITLSHTSETPRSGGRTRLTDATLPMASEDIGRVVSIALLAGGDA